LEEAFVSAGMGPASLESELVANLEPVSDLLDCCLFEIGWKRILARTGSGAGECVAAGISYTSQTRLKVESCRLQVD